MKKTLIAAVVLSSFMGVAQAASSVTLYGTLDGGLHYSKTTVKAKEGLQFLLTVPGKTTTTAFGITEAVQSSNKFGLKGSEDLGEDVDAIFKLEGGFSITNGASKGALFGRKAYFGISSNTYGTLTAGYQGNAVDELAPDDGGWVKYDFFGDIGGKKDTPGLKYVSPDFQGVQFAFSWAGTNEKTTAVNGTTKTHANDFALGLAYNLDGLSLNAGVSRSADVAGKPTAFILGAKYDFGPVAVFARYGQANTFGTADFNVVSDLTNNDELGLKVVGEEFNPHRVHVAAVALSAPVTETGTVYANYQRAWVNIEGYKVRGNAFNAAYVENLSKLTSIYAYGGYKTESVQTFLKTKRLNVAFGLTHQF